MPPPGQPPIELRLRTYAERRRAEAGGPFVPPPLTRRTVQAEVDRKWGHAARHDERLRWWNVMWPRLGWALGVTALLVIVTLAVLDLRPRSKSQTLAKDFRPEHVAPPAELETAPTAGQLADGSKVAWANTNFVTALPPMLTQGEAAGTPTRQANGAAASPSARLETAPVSADDAMRYGLSRSVATASSPTATERIVARTGSPGEFASAPATASAGQSALPAPTVAASAPVAMAAPKTAVAPGLPAAGGAPESGRDARQELAAREELRLSAHPSVAQNVQRFTQNPTRVLRQNVNSPAVPPVLQEFEVLQVGNALQFTDRDGSTYLADVLMNADSQRGTAVSAPAVTQAAPREPRRQAVRSPPQPTPSFARNQAASNALFFNAVGTNRTLRQRVVFTGQLVFANEQMPPPSVEVVLTNDAALGIWLDNSRVEGEALIGDRTRLQIEALPQP